VARIALSGCPALGRWALGLLATLILSSCHGARSEAPSAIVLIDIDTLRADGLSSYGNRRSTSPHLDELARGATRFAWAYSQAPYTLASQTSIVTSLYPWAHGVLHDEDRISAQATTLAEAMQAAGFVTAAFVDGGFLKAHFGFDQGFDEFVDLDGGGLRAGEARIGEWLERHARERFFLWIHTYDVHSPYAPPEPFRGRFVATAPAPTPGFEPTSEVLEAIRASQWEGPRRQLSDADLAYSRALYDGEVAFVDDWYGRFAAQARRLGVDRRAVVAVVSDHGEEFQEHGSVLHEKLYSTVTRVPMLIRDGTGGPSQVVDQVVETIDLAPTLLELAGVEIPPTFQGRSLAATVRLGSPPAPRVAVSFSPFYGGQRAVTDLATRLVLTLSPTRTELFRYRVDPSERIERSPDETREVRRLGQLLAARIDETRRAGVAESGELPDDVATQLRALGYLH